MSRALILALTASLSLFAACGSDDEPSTPDAGGTDGGNNPTGDAGVRAKCPVPENAPMCGALTECRIGNEMLSRDSRCGAFCPGWLSRRCGTSICPVVCDTGRCTTPETNLGDEVVNLNLDVGAVTGSRFFVRLVLFGQTTGGLPFTCADVDAAPTTFFQDPCYSVTDVRFGEVAPGPGNVFTFPFSRVPANERIVFVVYGFGSDDTSQPPIGISCTEVDVPAPGAGMGRPQEFNATVMRRL